MMMGLLVFKTRLKEIYEKHYKVIRSVLKILFSAGMFAVVFYQLPFQPQIGEYMVPLTIMLALICGFLPDVAIMCLVALLTIFEISALSAVAAFGFFAVLAIYFLLFGRYTKTQSYIVLLIPVLSILHLSYAVPVIAALFLSPAMIPACIVGVLIQYVIQGIQEYYLISQSAVDTGNTMEVLQHIIQYVMGNREMLIYMATFTITYLLVFVIRKGRFNHSSQIGIFVGIIACMGGVISGEVLWSVQSDANQLLIGLAVTTVAAYIVQFFRMSIDYAGTRKLQFEDEDYFYYVKAVPKLKVTGADKIVTKIEEDESRIDLREEIVKVLEEDIRKADE